MELKEKASEMTQTIDMKKDIETYMEQYDRKL
jgi:hypothetical protein